MAGSEIAVSDKFGAEGFYEPSFMIQDRPNSGINLSGLGVARQMSSITRPNRGSDAGLARHRSATKPFGNLRDRRTADLKVIYGHSGDMAAFEDHDSNGLNAAAEGLQQRPRRGFSGTAGGRLASLESIYMTKIPKLKPPMNMNV